MEWTDLAMSWAEIRLFRDETECARGMKPSFRMESLYCWSSVACVGRDPNAPVCRL